jgi:hypothetical protein
VQGSKKGKVHDVFRKRTLQLREGAKQMADSVKGDAQRPWEVPAELTTQLTDIASLHKPAFDRSEINANYDEVLASGSDPGTVGDAASLKLQVDFNAAEERAFRLRHATSLRCIIVAHGRLDGHGHQAGIYAAAENMAADLIAAGALGQAIPDPTISAEEAASLV